MQSVIDELWADAAKFGWVAIQNKKAHYDKMFREQIEAAFLAFPNYCYCDDSDQEAVASNYYTKKFNDGKDSDAGA